VTSWETISFSSKTQCLHTDKSTYPRIPSRNWNQGMCAGYEAHENTFIRRKAHIWEGYKVDESVTVRLQGLVPISCGSDPLDGARLQKRLAPFTCRPRHSRKGHPESYYRWSDRMCWAVLPPHCSPWGRRRVLSLLLREGSGVRTCPAIFSEYFEAVIFFFYSFISNQNYSDSISLFAGCIYDIKRLIQW
jgi:hypothetical protein